MSRNHAFGRRPDFFIVGNPKSGTTALHSFLSQHSGICMSRPKEPNFFAHDFYSPMPIAEYLRCFDDPEGQKLWGESSTCYAYSKVAAKNLCEFNPDAKIILILREPVAFLYSYYLQLSKKLKETTGDFQRALELEDQRRNGVAIPKNCDVPQLLLYSERTKYAEQIERFLNCFDRSKVSVLIYEDFKNNNTQTCRSILEFLGVCCRFTPAIASHNKSVKVKNQYLLSLAQTIRQGSGRVAAVNSVIKQMFPPGPKRKLLWKMYHRLVFAGSPDLDPALKESLKPRFRRDVEKVSEILSRDLVKEWDYDG